MRTLRVQPAKIQKKVYSGKSASFRKAARMARVLPSPNSTSKVVHSLFAAVMTPSPNTLCVTVSPIWNGLCISALSAAKSILSMSMGRCGSNSSSRTWIRFRVPRQRSSGTTPSVTTISRLISARKREGYLFAFVERLKPSDSVRKRALSARVTATYIRRLSSSSPRFLYSRIVLRFGKIPSERP